MSGDYRRLLDLSLSRGTLDRAALARREHDVLPAALRDSSTRVVDLVDGMARTTRVDGALTLVQRAPRTADAERLLFFLGRDREGVAHLAAVLDDDPHRPDTSTKDWRTLREAGAELGDTESGIFTSAVALANWHARHPHCPRCGSPTEPEQGGWVRRCVKDGSEHHPRTDTAVIVAVTDPEDRLLLARGPHWPEGRMSVLAGFVEAGESLEATVQREVLEEVGIDVHDVVYLGNQPWPFPASLMIGFRARATGVELTPDKTEIIQAQWFTRGELGWATRSGEVQLPPRVSIARRLIEDWYGDEIETEHEPTGPFRGPEAG